MMQKPIAQLSQLSQLANLAMRKGDENTVLILSLDEVKPKPQVRKRFVGIEELGENIKKDGQHHPIIVFPKNKEGKYVIQKGERRWRACKTAGLKTIKAIVNTAILDKLDEIAGELGENIHRDDLTSFEIADALQEFIDAGWNQADIGRRISKSRSFISLHLSLKRLPESIRTLLSSEICDDTTALNIVAHIYKINPVACRQLCEQAKLNKSLSRAEARKVLDALLGVQKPQDEARTDQATTPQATSGDGHETLIPSLPGSIQGGRDTKDMDAADSEPPVIGPEQQVEAMLKSASQSPAAQRPVSDASIATKPDNSHKLPSSGTTTTASAQTQKRPLPDETYGIVPQGQITVVCSVKVLNTPRRGELCLDRVDKETEYVWVKLYDEDGKPYAKEADLNTCRYQPTTFRSWNCAHSRKFMTHQKPKEIDLTSPG